MESSETGERSRGIKEPTSEGPSTSSTLPKGPPPSADEIEEKYLKYHSSNVYKTDWYFGLSGIGFAFKLLPTVQQLSLYASFSSGLLYLIAFVVGLGPGFFYAWRKKEIYIAYREYFVANSSFWTIFRYAFALQRVCDATSVSCTHFLLKLLLMGPHMPVILLGLAYPLRIQTAFLSTTLVAIATTCWAFFMHCQLANSPEAQAHILILSKTLCTSRVFNGVCLATTGFPCSAENVLLNVWCFEGGLSIIFMLLFTLKEESRRRKRFLRESELREPFPLFWEEPFFSIPWLAYFVVPSLGGALILFLFLLPG